MVTERSLHLDGADETTAFGRHLGSLLRAGDWVALTGDLGAGKTTLVAGVVDAIHPGARGRSPTYVRVEIHGSGPAILHADLYRVESVEAYAALGIEELAARDTVVLLEWADRAEGRLPPDRLELALSYRGAEARDLSIRPRGDRWERIVREGLLEPERWSHARRSRD